MGCLENSGEGYTRPVGSGSAGLGLDVSHFDASNWVFSYS